MGTSLKGALDFYHQWLNIPCYLNRWLKPLVESHPLSNMEPIFDCCSFIYYDSMKHIYLYHHKPYGSKTLKSKELVAALH